jgi:hypothetical protein
MQCGVFDIQRITQYQVTKGTGAEIVSGDFIEEISFNSESKILKREVLPVNATAPIVILDASPIAVICPSVGSKEPIRLRGNSLPVAAEAVQRPL